MEAGNLGYTAARVIAPIVDQSNEQGWVEFARYESLWEQIRKQGGYPVKGGVPADQVEALLGIMQSVAEAGGGPRGPENLTAQRAAQPPAQIHIHQCEECGKAAVQTSRGEMLLGAAELAQAQCDCQVSRPGKRNTASIPPAMRRRVLAEARHKCQRPGCDHTRYLEVHHKVHRSQGGSNEPQNLICLCSGCHRLVHEKSSAVSWVKSPGAVYRWDSGALGFLGTGAPGRWLCARTTCWSARKQEGPQKWSQRNMARREPNDFFSAATMA